MKLLICGSRTIKNSEFVYQCIDDSGCYMFPPDEIVSGGAIGVDTIAERYAFEHDIPVKRFNAKWKELGKKAGIIRDREMVEYADSVVAIWDGTSKGTKFSIDYTRQLMKPIQVFIKK